MDQRHNLPGWHRSTRCSTGTCVEVTSAGVDILVRDSKESAGDILNFDAREWTAFVAAVAAGEIGNS